MKILKLIIAIIICFSAGAIGSLATTQNIPTWYAALNKPIFTPPNWLFGPAWTILYVLMGIALYLVWTNTKKEKYDAYKFFFYQLILNALWSIVFFGAQQLLLAFVLIAVLWLSIIATMYYFNKINKWAMYLLIPYLGWVTFASALNLSVFLLNR